MALTYIFSRIKYLYEKDFKYFVYVFLIRKKLINTLVKIRFSKNQRLTIAIVKLVLFRRNLNSDQITLHLIVELSGMCQRKRQHLLRRVIAPNGGDDFHAIGRNIASGNH